MNDYRDFLAERRAVQFNEEPPKALSPEEATDSIIVDNDKNTKKAPKTKRKDNDK